MTVRNPQLFHSAPVSDLDKYIEDDEWVLEQKVDGMRCLTVIKRDIYRETTIEFFTRGGRPLKSAAAKLHFDAVREALKGLVDYAEYASHAEIVLDGEIVTESGKLVVLDLPYMKYQDDVVIDPQKDKLWQRRDTLESLFVNYLGSQDKVTIVAQSDTREFKNALALDVARLNLEGFIAKREDSLYDEGQRVKHSLKIKLTQTADVIVMAKNSGESKHSIRGGDKINYEFGVYDGPIACSVPGHPYGRLSDDGRTFYCGGCENTFEAPLRHIGNCSGIGKDNAEVGDVIEVEYLYAGAGGKLVQPRMAKIRDDKSQEDCKLDQLKYVNKEVL